MHRDMHAEALFQRAQVVAPDARERIMDLVERSFAEEARRASKEREDREARDWRMLTSVASILHEWDPPTWLEAWDPAGEDEED